MSKYAYKTDITKSGELKVHFPTLNFTNFAKFDAAKQSARDIAKTTLLSCLQHYINQRREIPTTDDYPFVAERIELDWQTSIRVRLSNWFIKDARYSSIKEIDRGHLDRCGLVWALDRAGGGLMELNIPQLFNLKAELKVTDLVILAYDFGIEIDFKEVKLEFKDND